MNNTKMLSLLQVATEWGSFKTIASFSQNYPNTLYCDAYEKMIEIEKNPIDFLSALEEIKSIYEHKEISYAEVFEIYLKTGTHRKSEFPKEDMRRENCEVI